MHFRENTFLMCMLTLQRQNAKLPQKQNYPSVNQTWGRGADGGVNPSSRGRYSGTHCNLRTWEVEEEDGEEFKSGFSYTVHLRLAYTTGKSDFIFVFKKKNFK